MNKIKSVILILFIYVLSFTTFSQTRVRIGTLINGDINESDLETTAAINFIKSGEIFDFQTISFKEIIETDHINILDVLWIHHSDSNFILHDEQIKKTLVSYLENGGKLLLTLEGFRTIYDLGLEPNLPETRYKSAKDEGYGRKLGLHAFRNHPVFEHLNGGAYIFKPKKDTTVRIHGYFDKNIPQNGAVVAVDWDYIFLRENSKLAIEYWVGIGKVLAVGGYTCLSQPNLNRDHLEVFLSNCLNYLGGNLTNSPVDHWKYYIYSVMPFTPDEIDFIPRTSKNWETKKIEPVITRDSATNNFWDVASPRMVIMGKETGGIDEIWSHPVMALKDFHTGIKYNQVDSIIWLKDLTPEIEVRPDCFKRIYDINGSTLKEIIFTSTDKPVGIVHYKYSGSEPVQMFTEFRSNLRFMWPYSEHAFKQIKYAYDVALNCFIFSEESENFTIMVGTNKEPDFTSIGQYNDFRISFEKINENTVYPVFQEISTDDFLVSGIFQFTVDPDEEFDIVIASGDQQKNETLEAYKNVILDTEKEYQNTHSYNRSLLKEFTQINTPDLTFNDGYKWALVSTDRFFVNTPGFGKSLVAGYSTTNKGWDGGHEIDGRPGYAWYFGRDGQWSGFAMLDYGDFKKVKDILETYQKFQDLNGKIYHEISTSGVVHYDAADATSLYIILAGRYLKHSGDIKFINESWSYIENSIKYCFSTDTDSDHLIENTNVGHGWVEGGSLFGSHSSLYLSSCWSEALKEASYMAGILEKKEDSQNYFEESMIIRDIINEDFWNDENDFFYQGKFIDGTYHPEHSIMPSIPIYFNQVDDLKASKVLPVFAEQNYTSDWGCRIVSRESLSFNPRGYHTGSVWPLFTGWVALAEFSQGLTVQGFSHLMNNLQVYKHWGLGFIEEVLNGETYEPSGVCRHQCWSETMVLQPAIEGLLGFKPNAPDHSFRLAPALPLDWDSLNVSNLRIGDHLIDFSFIRIDNTIKYTFNHQGSSVIKMEFDPVFEKGTAFNKINLSGNFETRSTKAIFPFVVYINDQITIELNIEKCIGAIPHICKPSPGENSKEIRIVGSSFNDNKYIVNLEGPVNTKGTVDIFIENYKVDHISNGHLIKQENNIYTFDVSFENEEKIYSSTELIIDLK